jgi:uncharacterized protein YbjT (DUF2867 family)
MILVSGATGNVGGQVVRGLAAAGRPVRALTRDPARARFPDGVEVVAGDLSRPGSLGAALAGVEALFLIKSGNEAEVAAAAKRAGVRRIVLLSALAAQTRLDSAIGRDHLVAEHTVQSAGLDWTLLRPGQFASNTLRWAPQVRAGDTVRAPFGDVALPTIHPADIAAVAAAALTTTDHCGQTYGLSGPAAVTPREQLRAIGAALGRDLDFQEIPAEQARARMLEHAPPVVVDAALALIGSPTAEEVAVLPAVERVTGAPARTFAQWARDNAAAFRAAEA